MPLPLLNNKRQGQLQIGESMMVLIILLLLGIVTFIFYFNSAKGDLELHLANVEEYNVLETAQIASNLQELKCPEAEGICFDVHKAKAMSQLELGDYYQDIFLNAKITLKGIYPSKEEYILYWDNASNRTQSSVPALLPVTMHNSTSGKNTFGILVVERYFR